MERGSDKHSPMRDDELKNETRGLVQGGRGTHAEEWKDPEPSGEDQPQADLAPEGTLYGGTPEGMDADDVEGRSQLASYLGKDDYPMVREQILDRVIDGRAPDALVERVRTLPSGRQFQNVNEVWEALGGNVETQRF